MKLGELFVSLGFKADNKKIADYSSSIDTARKGLFAIYAAAGTASAAVLKFTADAIESAWQLSNFSNQTGLSYEQLQKWQIMAGQAGVSSQNMATSIQGLQKNLAEIRLGKGNVQPFQMLGIDVMQDAFGVMDQLRDRVKGMDRMTATNFIQQMGFTPDMINLLTLTNDQLDKMRLNDTILSKGQVESLKSAGVAFQNMFRVMKYINSLIAVQLSPAIIKLSDKIREWAMTNKDKLIVGLEKIGNLLLRFIEATFNAFTMIDKIISKTIGWENALKGIVAVLAAVSIALMASPMGMFIASIVALIAVLDDLYVWKTGKGKSVFGEIFGSEKAGQAGHKKELMNLGTMLPGPAGVMAQGLSMGSKAFDAAKSMIQNNNIVINGVDKPNETASAIDIALKQQTNMASMQLNNAGI